MEGVRNKVKRGRGDKRETCTCQSGDGSSRKRKMFLDFIIDISGVDAPGKRDHERKKQIKTQATRVLATVKNIVRYRCLKCEVQGENIAPRVSYMVRMHIS